jgi:hypothetical protein
MNDSYQCFLPEGKPKTLKISYNISNREWKKMAEQVTRMGEKRYECRVSVGKSEGKRLLGRPGRKCVNNVTIGFKKWTGSV